MALLVIHLFQAVQVDVDGTDLLILHLLVGFQPLDVSVAVVQAGEHVAVAELFQIGLLLFAVQTVGHKELDGRQQGRVIVVRAGVVHPRKPTMAPPFINGTASRRHTCCAFSIS